PSRRSGGRFLRRVRCLLPVPGRAAGADLGGGAGGRPTWRFDPGRAVDRGGRAGRNHHVLHRHPALRALMQPSWFTELLAVGAEIADEDFVGTDLRELNLSRVLFTRCRFDEASLDGW